MWFSSRQYTKRKFQLMDWDCLVCLKATEDIAQGGGALYRYGKMNVTTRFDHSQDWNIMVTWMYS